MSATGVELTPPRMVPEGSWIVQGDALVGAGRGYGDYGLSFLFTTSDFLNGQVSATFHVLGSIRPFAAGLIVRANEAGDFVSVAIVGNRDEPDRFGLEALAFRDGALVATHSSPERIEGSEFSLVLDCRSALYRVTCRSDAGVLEAEYRISNVPFPGGVGLVRYHHSLVGVTDFGFELSLPGGLPPNSEASDTHGEFDAFICYSHRDSKTALDLGQQLAAAGIRVWIDVERVQPGDDVVGRIEEGVQGSRYVIVLLSQHSIASDWCQTEYRAAISAQISAGRERCVIPVVTEAISHESVPFLLRGRKISNIRDPKQYARLVEVLKNGTAPSTQVR